MGPKGGAKTICTAAVLAWFGIMPDQYHYSGLSGQRAGVLRRFGYGVRSRMSACGVKKTHYPSMGQVRKAIKGLKDPKGTVYMVCVLCGGVGHVILVSANGRTLVDTAPVKRDRRRVYAVHAVARF